MTSFETIRVEHDGELGRLELHRPERLNALSRAMLEEIRAASAHLDAAGVRVVVISGAGRAFSAGADLFDLASMMVDGSMPPEAVRNWARLGRSMVEAIGSMAAVTVASVRGPAVGGGMLLAAACDLRVAADDAVFRLPELHMGLPLAWGGVPLITRELGLSVARDLLLTCRPLPASEAHRLGFVHRLVAADDLAQATDDLARSLVDQPALALRSTKAQLRPGPHAADDTELLVAAAADPAFPAAAARYLARLRDGS